MADLRLSYRRTLARARLGARTVADLGPRTIGLVVANSARRQIDVWRAGAVRSPGTARRAAFTGDAPGRLLDVDDDVHGAHFEFENARLEVSFLASDVVRLSWGPGPVPVPYALADETTWVAPPVTVSAHAGGGRILATSDLVVSVDGEGSLRVMRPDGTLLCSEAPPVRRGAAWETRHSMRPGERFSGLGEQSAGVDLRGGCYRLWNRDAGGSWTTGQGPLYLGIPVVLASHADGDVLTFYENSTDATFQFGPADAPRVEAGTASVTFAGGVLRHYVMVGTVPHVLDRYSELTGRPALPPRWALGYHQSRWGYRTESDVRAVMDGYRSLGVPLSAIHLDIDYMDGYRVFTFDRHRFPAPAALAAELSSSGVRVVTIVDPGVKVDPGYDVYREGLARGLFCTDPAGRPAEGVVWPGRVVFPDFTDPAARSWWASHYHRLTDAGVAGVWHDMNEPASISLLGDPTLPLSTRHDFDGRGGDHAEAHNLYGLLMDRAGFEGLRLACPQRRPFIVSRSGWAGLQRWAWNWTGDVATTWAAMRQQMATVIGFGLSGVPYSGSDIGGFSGVPDDELYVRWLQMSVLLPYCRTHSVVGAPPREPWRFDEPARGIIAGWLRLRYRLLPYLYTLAHEAAASGAPLVRPWWWPPAGDDHEKGPGHAGDGQVDDAFLLGDALLVAPVTAPGARSRTVPLPAGAWASVWAGDAVRGEAGSEVVVEAPAGRIPVLVRRGSIVPLDDGWADPAGPCRIEADREPGDGVRAARAGELGLAHAPLLLCFHCWPDARGDARGGCIDDAGDGAGPARRDTLRLVGAVPGSTAVLTWERQGDYAAPATVRVVIHGVTAARVAADGRPVAMVGSVVDCAVFDELRLEDVRGDDAAR
jgi:alpha-glucosidase